MSDPIQDYIDEIEGKGGLAQGKQGSAALGPSPDFLDYGTSQQTYKEATFVEQEMLKSIDDNLARANKALTESKFRVSPLATEKGSKKAVSYEKGLRDTVSFLEQEKAQITAALELKKERLGKPMEVTAQESLVKARTPEGPPVIKQGVGSKPPYYQVKGPFLTQEAMSLDVPKQQVDVKLTSGAEATVKVDPNVKGSAATIGPEPAQSPQSAAKKVKKTVVSDITMTSERKVSPGGIEYMSPKSVNVPEMRVGQDPSGKPIKGKIPASQYLKERALKSDQAIIEGYKKQGADYAAQIAKEQINQYKTEFDFETGEVGKANLETILGTKPKYEDTMTASEKKELYRSQIKPAKPTTGLEPQNLGKPFKVKPYVGKGAQAFPMASMIPVIKAAAKGLKGKQLGGMLLPKKNIEEILGMLPGYGQKPEA